MVVLYFSRHLSGSWVYINSEIALTFHLAAHLNHFLELYYQQNYTFLKASLIVGMFIFISDAVIYIATSRRTSFRDATSVSSFFSQSSFISTFALLHTIGGMSAVNSCTILDQRVYWIGSEYTSGLLLFPFWFFIWQHTYLNRRLETSVALILLN